MKPALIFDLDGTLWDATGCVPEIWNRVFDRDEEVDLHIDQNGVEKLMGYSMEKIGQILFPDFNKEKQEQIMDDIGKEEVRYLKEHGALLFDHVRETLEQLYLEYPLYIVSNCQEGYVQAFLNAHQMEKYFQDFEMSGRTGMEKAENILCLMERNEIKKAYYIGDTRGDEKASSLAKIPFIHASYGFGKVDHPHKVIHSINELPLCVKQLDKEEQKCDSYTSR